jgi:hypothetical protein
MYAKEEAYQRALRTLEQLARCKRWNFRPPIYSESEIRSGCIILRDYIGELCRFRFTHRGRLELVEKPVVEMESSNGQGKKKL